MVEDPSSMPADKHLPELIHTDVLQIYAKETKGKNQDCPADIIARKQD